MYLSKQILKLGCFYPLNNMILSNLIETSNTDRVYSTLCIRVPFLSSYLLNFFFTSRFKEF